jgi:hypothetical protein
MCARRSNASKTTTHVATMLGLFISPNLHAQQLHQAASRGNLPRPPEVCRPIVSDAVSYPTSGKTPFSFEGREVPPVIRTKPDGTIRVE